MPAVTAVSSACIPERPICMKFLQLAVPSFLLAVPLVFSASAQEAMAQLQPVGQLEPVPAGAYAPVSVADPNVVTAADVAVKGESYRLNANAAGVPQKLELLAIVAAEQQVVAGVNYRLRLQVKHNGQVREAETVVLWQSWNQLPFEIRSWTWF